MEVHGKCPAQEFVDDLSERDLARFESAAAIVANNIRSGRSGGRMDKVRTSTQGLLELKITPDGGTAPFYRMLVLRRGNVLWAAYVFKKQSNDLKAKDISRGDSVAARWLAENSMEG